MNSKNEGPEVIYAYTRVQALEDGDLVDVTTWARQSAGATMPTAFTRALWGALEAIPNKIEDVRGRAHDVLFLMSHAIRRAPKESDRASFHVILNTAKGQEVLVLQVQCGPGDQAEPVLTVGFPEDF